MENRQGDVEGVERNMRRVESLLLLEMGDCKKSADGLEKRLSKLEDVSGRLDGVFHSIVQLKEGSVDSDQLVQPAFMLLLSSLSTTSQQTLLQMLTDEPESVLKQQNIWSQAWTGLMLLKV